MSLYGNSIIDYRNTQVVNEAYVGKTPTLEEIEKKIGELRENIKFSDNLNRSDKITEINRLFEKQFGMDIFALKVLQTKYIDAYTYSLSTRLDYAEKYASLADMITADMKNGFRFKPGNDAAVVVCISYEFLHNKLWTDAEIMAILLHEIGHNFSGSLYNDIYIANREMMLQYKKTLKYLIVLYAIASLCIVGIPGLIKTIKQYNNLKNKNIKKDAKKDRKKKPSKLKGFFGALKGKQSDYATFVDELSARMNGDKYAEYAGKYFDDMDSKGYGEEYFKQTNGRIDEVIADKFAGIYGYGPDQATALLKCDEWDSRAAKKIKQTGSKKDKENNLKYEKVNMQIHRYDIHPQTIQRINEELKLLKREIEKDDVDPKLKEVMLEQVKQLEDILKDATTTYEKIDKNTEARKLYNEYINDKYPDAVNDDIEEKIEECLDKYFDEAKEKCEKKYASKKKK